MKINNDFSIDYRCDKTKKHQSKRAFFKSFERFYLKEKKIKKCSKYHCDLENDKYKYKCSKCKGIYCGYCYKFDEHIKNNINNLLNTKNRCLIHKKDLVKYCLNCQKNLCVFCTKDNIHTNRNDHHNIKSLFEFIPTDDEIESMNQKIKKRKERYKELIQMLNE